MSKINIFWFRRDLRLEDNAGLYHALKSGLPVLPIFIFDKNILDKLEDKADARVEFIHQEIARLSDELEKLGSGILVKYGVPHDVWTELLQEYEIDAVFTNHDYEPYARERDGEIRKLLKDNGIAFHSFKDQVIFEKDEVLKDDGEPYVVFTPYKRKWLEKLDSEMVDDGSGGMLSFYFQSYPTGKYHDHFLKTKPFEIPTLAGMGFEPAGIPFPAREVKQGIIKHYDETRNFPAVDGTSRLGIHYRFGTISIRKKARKAAILNKTYLNELIWRDFYAMILWHFPHVVDGPFRPQYADIEWRNNEQEFKKWCEGKTGYPIVDAGMRELNETGYMHNRVRMIVASFLSKHLLINWQWGEAYFAKKLLDFDLASNSGGWQWAAGCGTDAAPYFRIFNPASQQEKFDKDLNYVKKWVPEFGTKDYPEPIVDHKMARERCLEVYKKALK
ncbi:MAG: deoxyribodipyrimidine photo-lyase [Lewinellaceae bacterium]|nr:deoxyribodipyrimidine photo-lyase [Saprospiraceae bacterium]MCB9340678.1 deoxyribodipyrimidine photo-lyase [Lewinellaceae bacterium]